VTSGDLTGKTVAGKYLIKRLIGAGGMGAVYEGEHVDIGKRVAIKVIHPAHAASEEIAARFHREARAASVVESEGIVQVFDVGSDPDVGLYMVMEYLTGEDLAQRLEREQRLEPPIAVDIVLQAARALAKAHAAGVIHRDLKPANLFLVTREDGTTLVKVLDFGISKLTPNAREPAPTTAPRTLTRAGVVIGTAQYMSPEQAQGLAVDLRTDVWSLGCVLYEALAGRSPYPEQETYEQTIIQIVTKRPTPLVEVAPWVPPRLAAIVHEALTPELDARLPDCGAFAHRLFELAPTSALPAIGDVTGDSARRSRAATPKPNGTGEGVAVASTGRSGSSRAPLATAAVVIVGLVVAAGVGLRSRATPEGPAYGLVQPASSAPVGAATPNPPPAPPRPAPSATAVTLTDASAASPPLATATAGTSAPVASERPVPRPKTTNAPTATPPKGQIGGLGATTEY